MSSLSLLLRVRRQDWFHSLICLLNMAGIKTGRRDKKNLYDFLFLSSSLFLPSLVFFFLVTYKKKHVCLFVTQNSAKSSHQAPSPWRTNGKWVCTHTITHTQTHTHSTPHPTPIDNWEFIIQWSFAAKYHAAHDSHFLTQTPQEANKGIDLL